MKFTEEIFKRATMRGITNYLLFGEPPQEEKRDYMTRLDDAQARFEKAILQQDPKVSSQLLNSVNEMVDENVNTFMEIGVQAGILLILDVLQNINAEKYIDCSKIEYEKKM